MKRAWSLCSRGGPRRRLGRRCHGRERRAKSVDVVITCAGGRREGHAAAREHDVTRQGGRVPDARTRGDDGQAGRVGDQKFFLGLDDVAGRYFVTTFTLRAIGEHIEIWVQNNLNFPTGDCRNDGVRNVVTQPQLDNFVHEFDTNIYPKESDAFSVPPDRDGSNATLPGLLGLPADYYAGDGDKIVTLVENVRDDNFYTPPNVQGSRTSPASSRPAERLLRPERDDDRRVRLAAPHGREPAERSRARTTARARPRGRFSTRGRSRTSTSTCSSPTRTPTRSTGSTRASPTGRRRSSGTSTPPRRSPTSASTRTSSASSAGSASRRPPTRTRTSPGRRTR